MLSLRAVRAAGKACGIVLRLRAVRHCILARQQGALLAQAGQKLVKGDVDRFALEPGVELLEKLAAITPRPAVNLVVHHGVLAPRAGWRSPVNVESSFVTSPPGAYMHARTRPPP